MTHETTQLTVYFDFLCPFAYRASVWLDQVEQQLGSALALTWKYFPLEQVNAPAGSEWKLWEQPDVYESPTGLPPASHALLAFWAAEAARQQGVAAFDRFRLVLFHRRHRDGGIDFSIRENFHPVAHEAGLDLAHFGRAFADRALLETIQRDYEEARATHKVFGVPTLCYDPDNAIYLKLQQVPPPDDTLPLFEELRRSITTRRWLTEIKRPNP